MAREGFILETKRLPAVDRRVTSAINHHVPGRSNAIVLVLLRTWHPLAFIWRQQRPLHFLHRRRDLSC